MKMTKKNSSFITALLIAIMFNCHSMESPTPTEQSTLQDYIRNLLLGNTHLMRGGSSPLQQLDPETEEKINSFFMTNNFAKTVQDTAEELNKLFRTSPELHNIINNADFCLKLIKHLARRFNRSDEEVAKALQIPEAKKQLTIQTLLFEILSSDFFDEENFNTLYRISKGTIDLNFTYTVRNRTISLLFYAMLIDNKNNSSVRTSCLLKTNAIDVNKRGPLGTTALMFATQTNNYQIMQLLCKYPGIDLNQTYQGMTPLMLCCLTEDINLEYVTLLLNSGADPEIASDMGLTPLQAAQNAGNAEAVRLIKKAIRNRHSSAGAA